MLNGLHGGTEMNGKAPVLCNHLNILGLLAALVAVVFLVVYFNVEEEIEGTYFLAAALTFFVISILSFGFAKIIELIDRNSG